MLSCQPNSCSVPGVCSICQSLLTQSPQTIILPSEVSGTAYTANSVDRIIHGSINPQLIQGTERESWHLGYSIPSCVCYMCMYCQQQCDSEPLVPSLPRAATHSPSPCELCHSVALHIYLKTGPVTCVVSGRLEQCTRKRGYKQNE